MIEIICPSCKQTYERRGKNRGGIAFCIDCKTKSIEELRLYGKRINPNTSKKIYRGL